MVSVITSYSIHYTKLYEQVFVLEEVEQQVGRLAALIGLDAQDGVITSYSIHYTKLYDLSHLAQIAQD